MQKRYTMPCGIITCNKHRKHHNWVMVNGDGERVEWGEDYDAATRVGHQLALM